MKQNGSDRLCRVVLSDWNTDRQSAFPQNIAEAFTEGNTAVQGLVYDGLPVFRELFILDYIAVFGTRRNGFGIGIYHPDISHDNVV